MGYLNNATITVDAILTKKGRELLARGRDEFKITQFALADDEVDYDLYNPDHPLGTAFYGAAIENMPIVEALPDETQMLKYKLVTLPKGTARIPVVKIAQTVIELNENLKKFIEKKGYKIDFEKCINDKKIEDFVLNDRVEGAKEFKVNSTPTIIINNKKFDKSLNYKNLKKSLEKLI